MHLTSALTDREHREVGRNSAMSSHQIERGMGEDRAGYMIDTPTQKFVGDLRCLEANNSAVNALVEIRIANGY